MASAPPRLGPVRNSQVDCSAVDLDIEQALQRLTIPPGIEPSPSPIGPVDFPRFRGHVDLPRFPESASTEPGEVQPLRCQASLSGDRSPQGAGSVRWALIDARS